MNPASDIGQRILILGSGGSGKTTLALRLGAVLSLPVIHLDRYFWKPAWVASETAAWEQRVNALCSAEAWVMDGNFSGTLPRRLAACDTVIILEFSRWLCLFRVLKRVLEYRGSTRPDMAEGCHERFDWAFLRWVWSYPQMHAPRIFADLDQRQPPLAALRFRRASDLETWLGNIESWS